MQFLADVELVCEECKGMRFKPTVLDVRHKGRNIHAVLDMTVREAMGFFADIPRIVSRLQVLDDVGLGYLRLGQSATTLSGGEAQRVKLAAYLSRRSATKTLYIFDEPTTGLHFDDINKLLTRVQPARREREHARRDRAQSRRDQDRGLGDRPGTRGRGRGRRGRGHRNA